MEEEQTITDYEVGQDNITPFGLDIHNPVFLISGISIVAFVIVTLMFQQGSAEFFAWLRPAITSNFDWFFLSAGNLFVIFALVICVSPLGRVRLGGQDATPDFGYVGWFSMLFAAGMGIGLMFFGVSEPMSHFASSMGGTAAATIYHWGLHPWAMYAVVGLGLAFFSFNYKLPLTLRSVFYPLLGERVWGWWGHIIDTIAVFATLFGLATSLGFGTQQALAGFNYLYDWGTGGVAIVLLIAVITAIAIISVIRGLDGGVKLLSELNMGLALLLLAFIFVVGPTADIISTMISGAGAYVAEFIPLSMPFGREDTNFSQGWTSFYWAWWISWSPFVGMFIARVSRGRSVREFIVCVILIPTVLCILWMATFGGTALSQVITDASAPVGAASQEIKLFHMLADFPLSGLLSLIGIVLVLVFFVTSSDSGSLVIDTITAGGKTDAPVSQRVFWCVFEGLAAAVLLLVGGAEALGALQAMAVSTGLPFTVVLLAMCVSLWIGLSRAAKEL
jgi:BCCT family betaine/carnitine transporter